MRAYSYACLFVHNTVEWLRSWASLLTHTMYVDIDTGRVTRSVAVLRLCGWRRWWAVDITLDRVYAGGITTRDVDDKGRVAMLTSSLGLLHRVPVTPRLSRPDPHPHPHPHPHRKVLLAYVAPPRVHTGARADDAHDVSAFFKTYLSAFDAAAASGVSGGLSHAEVLALLCATKHIALSLYDTTTSICVVLSDMTERMFLHGDTVAW